MIVTVTLNPAVDVTYRTPALRPGHSHRVADVVRRAGGKGLNVARVLAAQGYATLAVAPVGGAPGDQIRADLDSSGLPHQLVETGVPTRHTVAVVTDTETTNLNEAGPPLPPESVDALGDVLTDALREATVVVFSGSLPGGTDPSVLTYLLTLVRQAGVPAVVDTSGRALTATAETGARVLKPNRDELLAAVGGSADAGLPQLLAAARRLATRGGGAVFASLGEAGMLAVDGPDAWHGRLDAPLTGNPTGAGDAAVAAIAADLSTGSYRPDRTLARAVRWSAAAVLTPAAGSIDDAALADLSVHVTDLPDPGPSEEDPP